MHIVLRHQLIKRPVSTTHCAQSMTPPLCTPPTTDARPAAYVYAGEGAGSRSVLSAVEALQLATTLHVQTISAEATIQGNWTDHAALLVMPGGADLPYCRCLNGIGNQVIRRFVQQGGAYLGLCAGAYYACAAIEFEPGHPRSVV